MLSLADTVTIGMFNLTSVILNAVSPATPDIAQIFSPTPSAAIFL